MSPHGHALEADSPREPHAAWLILFLLVVVIVVWSAGLVRRSTSSQTQQASSYINDHGSDASTVQAVIEDAVGVMVLAVNSPTTSNTRYLVGIARVANKTIDKVRRDLARDERSGALRSAETDVLNAAIDLKSTIGALFAYTSGGFTSPLADLTSRYDRARREWNAAVQRIWRIAEDQSVPSIP